eukprot:12688487-Prorocentrum_lima.AAC.1
MYGAAAARTCSSSAAPPGIATASASLNRRRATEPVGALPSQVQHVLPADALAVLWWRSRDEPTVTMR